MKLILSSVILAAIGFAQIPPPCPPLCPPPELNGRKVTNKKPAKNQKPQTGEQSKTAK
jgi:hypothetical protein